MKKYTLMMITLALGLSSCNQAQTKPTYTLQEVIRNVGNFTNLAIVNSGVIDQLAPSEKYTVLVAMFNQDQYLSNLGMTKDEFMKSSKAKEFAQDYVIEGIVDLSRSASYRTLSGKTVTYNGETYSFNSRAEYLPSIEGDPINISNGLYISVDSLIF